ncbi:AgmX/PglI C-terminal domain-containing protein [Bermanella sp. WJH001]|uniref:AgmX/PglI C-terminal domain-containing protein n=1 Tax=Bermanella sp. WJH001 TaxID=3048005 RepID=UPI0024BEB6DF|nr:AgmX/PglI C-terminal domain-containing protein [Bermanella sp. WJH001]MDJ1537665.1 AgmX/PglI C-terminal domain-containing protein [Bermanella sp. WJH001]
MSSLTFRSTELPWSDSKQEHLFNKVLIALLMLTLILGIAVPNITLPELKRENLEKLPPQLAKVIKRKKEAPKPKPVPKVEKKIEKPVEKKVEPKKVEAVKAKPKPKPVVVAKPKPKPKPKPVTRQERTPERIKAAKEVAKKLISNFAPDLADMRNMVDNMSALTIDSSVLTNAGAAATDVGSVVDQAAVDRVGGIDETQLTRATGAEQLATAQRDTTEVKAVTKDELVDAVADTKVAGMSRTQMQIRRVFEQNKSRFDRIYRKALRSNPVLQGTVTLGIEVAASGEVSDCNVKSSDLEDAKVIKRITMTCKMLAFDAASKEDKFEYPLTFAP